MVRFHAILCPVDFFPPSMNAVEYAIGLAKNYGAKLHILHVVSPVVYQAEQAAFTLSEVISTMQKSAEAKMKKVEAKARSAGLTISTDIRIGDIKTEMESAMQKTKADLLVMGTHGRQGIERWLLGSVTERMLRRSPIPVLVLHGSKKARTLPAAPLILFAADFSEGTSHALDYAVSISKTGNGRLILMHVLEDTRAVISPQYRKKISETVRQDLLQLLPAHAKDLKVDTVVDAGTAYHAILKTLKKEKIDLLVMGTHGKSALERTFIGSTSERVVRAAEYPVLLIPPAKTKRTR